MGRLFGTDGVRGIANKDLTVELAYKLGRAGAYVLTSQSKRPKILIGRDTRISGNMLEAALVAGICSVGAEARLVGVLPTPAIAYLTRHYNADAGIVISASHNSMEYNGIKFLDKDGFKLSDETENRIEAIILDNAEDIDFPTGVNVGVSTQIENAEKDYYDFLISTAKYNYNGLKVVLDCANGAAYDIAPKVFNKLGAEVVVCNNKPNGININHQCGSTHTEGLMQLVKETGADIGLAFDGDADRVLAVDENGVLVDGDKIMGICAMALKRNNKLKNNTLVATVMSNLGLFVALNEVGINVEKTNVGDRYVIECMREKEYILGGEQSGHIVFLEHNTTGDGILTAIQLLDVLVETSTKLSELSGIINKYPQVLVNAKVDEKNKRAYIKDDLIKKEIERIENKFHGEGRVLIRPSGTEPLVRVMIEAKDQDSIKKEAEQLACLIEQRLK